MGFRIPANATVTTVPCGSITEALAMARARAAASGRPSSGPQYTATVVRPVDTRRPYRVRMTCGHVVVRTMREELAGVAWSETVELSGSVKCAGCQ